jgi:hypothetical protein
MPRIEFLDRYNRSRTVEEALSKSISAAVQHNRLYENASNYERFGVRSFWKSKLLVLSNEFREHNWHEDAYEVEILKLKQAMNEEFRSSVDFRISHAQKSLGVFFKHLWCMDLLPLPPQCPVDRIILTRANAPYNQRSWGFVNDIHIHREKYAILRTAARIAGFQSVPEWELFHFGNL